MATYAVVRDSDGMVMNVVVWDGSTTWSPPTGTTAVLAPTGEEEPPETLAVIGGWYDSETGFHWIMPSITDVDSDTGPAAGGTTVTVTGLNLDYGTVDVKFDGTSATNITNRTATSLQCDTPAHAAGAVDVTVENETGSWTGQNTLADGFTYT